jgi:class 3 adenylate cyclase
MQPETTYAKSGDVHIAYQVVGNGPFDLVLTPGWVSHLQFGWEWPSFTHLLERLAAFSRLICFDKRGTGLSDRVPDHALPTLEERMDDVRAVMDAVGSERAALFGMSEGSSMCALFAATYPERTRALVMYGAYARRLRTPDHPWGPTREERLKFLDLVEREWGGPALASHFVPSQADDPRFARWYNAYQQAAASPGAAMALVRMNMEIDIREILATIRVPTLVLHRTGDRSNPVAGARYIASQIPGAKYFEVPGEDHALWVGEWVGEADELIDVAEEFLTGVRPGPKVDRQLATVLFTDIVGSTEHAARLGDRHWRELLDDHDRLVRRQIERARGRLIKHTGDGVLATFDGPARAVRCAGAIRDEVRELGMEVRAGLHTGECDLVGDDVGGIAVHIGQRVSALAEPNEVLVSSTVKDLVAGSGLRFEDRDTHSLKGIPGEWRLFRALP